MAKLGERRMIYIQVQNLVEFSKSGYQPDYSIGWHLGEDNNLLRDTNFPILHVLSVQADGDELAAIVREVQGIPWKTASVQKWFGDDAKFIVANFIIPRVNRTHNFVTNYKSPKDFSRSKEN